MLISVIIPTYHRNDLLAKCLDCLAANVQTLATNCYEVIVTDDGVQTTAEEMINNHYPWVKWVTGSRSGPAANRNNGARYAQGDWLVFTDDDCLPDPQWLEAYAKNMISEMNYLVLEGRTYADRPRRSLAETSPVNESGGYLWSCNFSIHRELFVLLSGFDERFPYAAMEDVELRLRLTKSGYKFLFIRDASVCHPWRQKGGWEKLKQHQKSTLMYLSIHPEESSNINSMYYLRMILYKVIKITIPQILKLRFHGIHEEMLEYLSFLQMSVILSHFNLVLRARKNTPKI
jgi:GT2 family glycosyltransferase